MDKGRVLIGIGGPYEEFRHDVVVEGFGRDDSQLRVITSISLLSWPVARCTIPRRKTTLTKATFTSRYNVTTPRTVHNTVHLNVLIGNRASPSTCIQIRTCCCLGKELTYVVCLVPAAIGEDDGQQCSSLVLEADVFLGVNCVEDGVVRQICGRFALDDLNQSKDNYEKQKQHFEKGKKVVDADPPFSPSRMADTDYNGGKQGNQHHTPSRWLRKSAEVEEVEGERYGVCCGVSEDNKNHAKDAADKESHPLEHRGQVDQLTTAVEHVSRLV